jgi:hypothetical protein
VHKVFNPAHNAMTTAFQDLQSTLAACLPDQSLRLQVNHVGNQVSVMINRPADNVSVDYDLVAEVLISKLRSLNLPNVSSVKLYGRPANSKQIEWQVSHALVTEPVKPLGGNNGSGMTAISSQKVKSKFQNYLEQFSHYSNVISAASLLGLLALLGFNTLAGQKTQSVVYEYKIESVNDLIFTETMNTRGVEGWDLVFARRARDSDTERFEYECIFKRVKK